MLLPKRFISHLVGTAVFTLFLGTGHAQQAGKKLNIAVIPKGTTHVFWKSVEAGARQAAQELGVDMTWKGPLKEDDRAQQISIVEQFVSEGRSGIVLAPLDENALRRPVDAAMEKKIPVIIIDSTLKGEVGKDFIGFCGTNNKQGGTMGGEELARLLDGKGKVILLRYQEGSASTSQREEGFLEAIKKHPDIQILLDNRYAGATVAEAQSTAMNIIDKLRVADGIFCPNESSTFGMLLALKQNNLAGKIKLVGFDTSPPLIEGLKKGEIQALVAQNPKKMLKKPSAASLTLHRGEVLGIAGLVGAGRTELLRAIFGLDPIRSGQIKLKVYSGPASPLQQWARGMGMVSEDRKIEGLALSLSIADNLTLSSLGRFINPAAQADSSRRWIKRLAIRCREPQQPVGNLSGGNQQKVAISRLLEHGVDVLLLDEPTRGIDVGSKAQIYHVIDELACEGKAVLIVSS